MPEQQKYSSSYKGTQIDTAYTRVSQITSSGAGKIVTIDGQGKLIPSGVEVNNIPARPIGEGSNGDIIVYDTVVGTRVASGVSVNTIDTLETDIGVLQAKVQTLEVEVEALETRVQALEDYINRGVCYIVGAETPSQED